jgi:hypothetical protein
LKRELIWLLQVQPRNPATGAEIAVRLAGGGTRGYTQFGSAKWWAGLERPSAIVQRLGFSDGDFGAGAIVQALELRWGGTAKRGSTLASYYWPGAKFTLHSGPDGGTDAEFTQILAGRIADISAAPGRLTLQMADPSKDLERPVLGTATFAGSGGIEGIPELKGRFKRRAVGRVRNVELWSLDPANNIWVATDPARQLLAIDQVYDRGNAASALVQVAWQGSIAATLAALAAAACPQGGAAVAPSIACVKWWFANPGKLTCDLRGETGLYIDRPADIAAWAVAAVNGPAVNIASLNAARALRNLESGLLVSGDENAGSVLNDVLGGVTLWWGMTSGGELEFGEWAFGVSAGQIIAAQAVRSRTHKPVKKISLGYRRNHYQMARGDIAAAVLLSDVEGAGDLAGRDTVRFGDGSILQGNGTTPATDAAYRTIDGVASVVINQGPGATAPANRVMNDRIENGVLHVAQPDGGTALFAGNQTGQLQIILPFGYASYSMVRFDIVVSDLSTGGMATRYTVAGYLYADTQSWSSAYVTATGPRGATLPVKLGSYNGFAYVWIGDVGTAWYYPAIRVENLTVHFGQVNMSWASGWDVSFNNTNISSLVTAMVQTPRPGDAVFGEGVFEQPGGAIATRANFRTDQGISQGYVGQTPWGTYNITSPAQFESRTQFLSTSSGRASTGRMLPTNFNVGIRALASTFQLSDSDAGGSVTINIAAATRTLDDGTTVSYPSGSITGLPYATTYFVWRNDPDLNGGSSYSYSTSIGDALGTGKVYLGAWTTRATAGGSGGGGSGGGGGEFCVRSSAFVRMTDGRFRRAIDVLRGDQIACLVEGAESWSLDSEFVESNAIEMNECVQLKSASGILLTLALNTPIVTRQGWDIAANARGYALPVFDKDGLRWEEIVEVVAVGKQAVAHIVANDCIYGAGDQPGAVIYTHNPEYKP